jgi:hypothetical protein
MSEKISILTNDNLNKKNSIEDTISELTLIDNEARSFFKIKKLVRSKSSMIVLHKPN